MKNELKKKYYHDLTAEEQNQVIKKILNKKNKSNFVIDDLHEKIKASNIKSFILNWLTVEQALNF